MSDKLFFPLMLLIAGAMIFTALAPYEDRPPSGPMSGGARNADRSVVIVDGRDLFRLVSAGPALVEVRENDGPNPVYVRITQRPGAASDVPERGVHLPLAADLERTYAGKRLRITLTARAGGEIGATRFEAAYSIGRKGGSGWQAFDLTPDFAEYSFEYALPPIPPDAEDLSLDFLGLRPVVEDKTRAVDVTQIRFDMLGPA